MDENREEAVYRSSVTMTRQRYEDFCSVGFGRVKHLSLLMLILGALVTPGIVLEGYYDVAGSMLFVVLLLALLRFNIARSAKIGYERSVVSEGKESTVNGALYEDKIVSQSGGAVREHSYSQITGLFETKTFLLLHLRHELYIILDKEMLGADFDGAKAFLLGKCTQVKKKKFIDRSYDRTWSLIFMIALAVLPVAGRAVGRILP